MVASKSAAQTIQTMRDLIHPKTANPQIKVGGQPERIAININTNKVYIWNPRNGTVSVIDSNMGTVKDILLFQGEGKGYDPKKNNFGSIAVDDKNNRIYVADEDSDTVYVIDGKNDAKITQIPVGKNPRLYTNT